MASGTQAAASTARYAKKREAILSAATEVLNREGVKGMTLTEVASAVGLNTTSITYYFRKKEDLAAACFLAGIERMNGMIAEAGRRTDRAGRVGALLEAYLERTRLKRTGEGPPSVTFLDIRTPEEPHLSQVMDAFHGMVRSARALLDDPAIPRKVLIARTELMLDQVFWSGSWLGAYDIEDFPRVHARAMDIILHGLPSAGREAAASWPPAAMAMEDATEPCGGKETFLVASTRLINQLGYRGASVERISAELNVTKGSFYHHNDAKDELVIACFDRTDAIIRDAQARAIASGGAGWQRLSRAVCTLLAMQNTARGPLLRTSALRALPAEKRDQLIERAQRTTGRFAAMVSDAIADGSIRPVDPMIAAHLLTVGVNAAAELPERIRGAESAEAVELIGAPLLFGLH